MQSDECPLPDQSNGRAGVMALFHRVLIMTFAVSTSAAIALSSIGFVKGWPYDQVSGDPPRLGLHTRRVFLQHTLERPM